MNDDLGTMRDLLLCLYIKVDTTQVALVNNEVVPCSTTHLYPGEFLFEWKSVLSAMEHARCSIGMLCETRVDKDPQVDI